MKKVFLAITFALCISQMAFSQAITPLWIWQNNFNADITDIVYHNNYLYTCGVFSGNAFVFGNASFNNQGLQDVVVMKWDTSGNLLWAQHIAGTGDDGAAAVSVNGSGEIVVAGTTTSSAINIGGSVFPTNGSTDIFVAKYNINGSFINANIIGTAASEICVDMCIDAQNNFYIAGTGGVTKYTSNATIIWQRPVLPNKIFYSVVDNTIILTGPFTGTFTADNFSIVADYSVNWGVQPDVYALKLSTSNSPLWLINLSNDTRGDFSLQSCLNEQSGKFYAAYSFIGLAGEYMTIREITSLGVLTNQFISFLEMDGYRCNSMSAHDSLLSFHTTQWGNTNFIYNLNTFQPIKSYIMSGNNQSYFFQCIRGIDALYTSNSNSIQFGKIGGSMLTADPSQQNVNVCLGSTVSLSGNITGGVGTLTYSWLPVTGLNNTNTNTVSFTAASNISYTLTVTDGINQIAKDTFNINVQTPIPPPNLTSQFPLFCADSMALYANNGVAGYWIKDNWTYNYPYNFGLSTFIFLPGKYRYQGVNACGVVNDSITILPAIIVNAISSDDTICNGQSITLNGSGALTYSWTAGVVNNVAYTPLSTQTYTVTGIDINGCKDTASIRIVVKDIPLITNIAATPSVICNQGNALLSIDTTASYCIPTVQSPGALPLAIFNFNNEINNNTGQTPGTYTYFNLIAHVTAGMSYPISIAKGVNGGDVRNVWIDYNQDGDFDDQQEQVFFSNSPVYIVNGTVAIPLNACNGKTRMRVACKDAGINTPCYNNSFGQYEDYNIEITGGADKITWLPGTFLPNNIGNNINVTNINATTTYTVTAVDLINGCSNTDSVTIHVYPNTTSTTNASICVNQIPYVWAGLNIDSPGVYTAILVNANGCDSVATLNLNISVCGLCQNGFTANWSPFVDSLVESQTWINTSGTVLIPVGAKVKFDANVGGYVTLNPGFKADSGSVFIAQAYNGCTAGAPQLPNAKIFSGATFINNEIILYPNPTSGMIHLKHDEKLTGIQIFDMVGKLIINQKCNGETETNIDLSNLPNGVYHVKAAGYNSIKVVKNN